MVELKGAELEHAIKRPDVKGNDRYKLGPVLRGGIYCSPWCGCHCTKAAYDQAVREANELAARMGEGWVAHVWENGGWHYKVKRGCVTITTVVEGSPSRGWSGVLSYTAWIEPAADRIGSYMVQFIEQADTPEDALGFATQAARTHMARLTAALADVLA